MDERGEFKSWLKLNRNILEEMSASEVAEIAIRYGGFTIETVCFVLSHFEDAMRGSNFDNRSKMKFDHEAFTIESMSGKVDLYDYWQDLHKKLMTGRDYDE